MKKRKTISTDELLKKSVQKSNDEYKNDQNVPREVVDLLIETHPLRGSGESFDEEKHVTRYTKLNDKSFSQEVRQAEEDFYKNDLEDTKETAFNNEAEEAFEEEMKIVKTKQKKKRTPKGSQSINVSDISKQADLDDFFDTKGKEIIDENDDLIINIIKKYINVDNPERKKIIEGSIIGFFCIFIILFISTIFLGGSLAKSNSRIAQSVEIEEQNSELKLKINQLEEELGKLDETPDKADENEAGGQSMEETLPQDEKDESENSNAENMDTYTVADGDTFWDISKKIYGNGANYQKILDANNLKETDSIKAGQILKIPKN